MVFHQILVYLRTYRVNINFIICNTFYEVIVKFNVFYIIINISVWLVKVIDSNNNDNK